MNIIARRISISMVGVGAGRGVLNAACEDRKRYGDDHHMLLLSDQQSVTDMVQNILENLNASEPDAVQFFDVAEVLEARYVYGHLQRLISQHPEKVIHVFLDIPSMLVVDIDRRNQINLIFEDSDTDQTVRKLLADNPNIVIEIAALRMDARGLVRFASAADGKNYN